MGSGDSIELGIERWFAMRVKSGTEKTVSTITRNKGFEEFLPLYTCRRQWSDRTKSFEAPLFPGYVFCRLDPRNRMPLLTVPSVLGFVGFGNVPAPIDDSELEGIRAMVRSGFTPEPWPYLQVGQRVRVQCGPLQDLEGIFVEERNRHRIVVSIHLLMRSIAVEIERHWIRPVDTALPVPMDRNIAAKAS